MGRTESKKCPGSGTGDEAENDEHGRTLRSTEENASDDAECRAVDHTSLTAPPIRDVTANQDTNEGSCLEEGSDRR